MCVSVCVCVCVVRGYLCDGLCGGMGRVSLIHRGPEGSLAVQHSVVYDITNTEQNSANTVQLKYHRSRIKWSLSKN
jgi:hypothetical protein